MLLHTDSRPSPWWFVNNNNKKVGRLEVIRLVLDQVPYTPKEERVVRPPDPGVVLPARDVLPQMTAV
jgi:hypothetical protein